jgi:hypothetical protein
MITSGPMTRHLFVPIACVLTLVACTVGPEDPFTSLTGATSVTLSNTNGMDTLEAEGESGDGDGDPGTTDGDGDPTTTGDGDGDPTTTGDGDGDGDGDAGDVGSCGWLEDPTFPGYYCDGSGEDPMGVNPIECPPGLADGAPCGELTGAGCCDDNGDNWYCGMDDAGNTAQVFAPCG